MATKEINIEITTDNSNNNNIQKKQIEDTNIIGKDDKVENGNLDTSSCEFFSYRYKCICIVSMFPVCRVYGSLVRQSKKCR